jgi:hypothetical protein
MPLHLPGLVPAKHALGGLGSVAVKGLSVAADVDPRQFHHGVSHIANQSRFLMRLILRNGRIGKVPRGPTAAYATTASVRSN